MTTLEQSGEPIPTIRPPSRASTSHKKKEKEIPFMTRMDPLSSLTQEGTQKPRGTGDDPFTLSKLDVEEKPSENGRLEGIPSTALDGDRSKTLKFLMDFKSFIIMNEDARIARNPMKQCEYFLSLVQGPQVKGWSLRQHDWLDEVRQDLSVIP